MSQDSTPCGLKIKDIEHQMEKLSGMRFTGTLLQAVIRLSHFVSDLHMFHRGHILAVFGIDHCGTEILPQEVFVMLQQPFITTRQLAVGLFHPAKPFDFTVQRFQ